MNYVEKLNIRDVLYLIHDLELRSSVNNEELQDSSDQIPTSHAVYTRIGQVMVDLLENTLASVALSGDYNDLINTPDIGGIASVEGTALVFNSSSEGLTPIEVEFLESIIGSGEL